MTRKIMLLKKKIDAVTYFKCLGILILKLKIQKYTTKFEGDYRIFSL